MTEFVTIMIKWYAGQSGPNECDLMRAMQDVVNLYKVDANHPFDKANTDEELTRAVDWLHAKYGSKT